MRIAAPFILAVGLIAPLGLSGAASAAAERSRVTSFTLSPAESLAPHPRTLVETQALPAPAQPEPTVIAATPLSRDELLGRWTERDTAYCQDDQYVLEWTRDRMRILLDGRAIDSDGVRYVTDDEALKVERLSAAGDLIGYWRLGAVDNDHVQWLAVAEQRGGTLAVTAKANKFLTRCPAGTGPPPSLVQRAQRWWASLVGS
jgi:hypothetical protein